ncbi:hypothetical protein Tco_1067552 [Tanacetum coccineum]|uniref:Uncharacterized protein n=1 Tax=Tanacetum coccineum TaxID=301880 RepID=A0ABQ5HD75_9ASTR
MDTKLLQARESLMETIQAFLKEYDHIPPEEKCMALLLAEERFLKIKQAVEEKHNQPEVMQELLLKLMNDLQILKGIQPKQAEQAAKNSSITSPKIDFLPEEFVSELDFINLILPEIDEDDFDEDDFDEDDFDKKEGEIDNDILQIEDEILREKLLNVNLLIDKIEALNLTPSIPFVLEYPSSSPITVVDSDFLIEEVDTFLVPEDSIPPGIESDLDSEGDIVFLDNLLNEDPIPEYERFTFDIEPDAPVINNFDELNEDECFDPGGGEINVS